MKIKIGEKIYNQKNEVKLPMFDNNGKQIAKVFAVEKNDDNVCEVRIYVNNFYSYLCSDGAETYVPFIEIIP